MSSTHRRRFKECACYSKTIMKHSGSYTYNEVSRCPYCCCSAYVNGKIGKDMNKMIKCNYVMCDSCEEVLIGDNKNKDYEYAKKCKI